MGGLTKHLLQVERWTLVLAAVVMGASVLALPRHLAFSASVGAGLMCLNAYAIRKLGERTLANEARAQRPSAAILLFNVKMFALIGLIIVAVRVLHLDAVGFILGVSVFPVAVLITALQAGISDEESDNPLGGPAGPARGPTQGPPQGDR